MIWGAWYWKHFPDPKLAVDIFMLVSGYLMVHQWAAKGEPINLRASGRFLTRRYFRIAPVYYLALAVVWLMGRSFLRGFSVLRAQNPNFWANGPAYYDPANCHLGHANLLTHVTF